MILYANRAAELNLYDATGRLIKKAMLSCGKNQIEIKGLPGIYFYILRNKKETKRGKIIVF